MKHHSLKYLFFDYTNANMDKLDTEDAKIISEQSEKLVLKNPSFKMIGFMPKESDYEITNVWTAYSTRPKTKIDFNNIIITKSLSEAIQIVEDQLSQT